jgi:GNAT superfamily N-acetyltransferase
LLLDAYVELTATGPRERYTCSRLEPTLTPGGKELVCHRLSRAAVLLTQRWNIGSLLVRHLFNYAAKTDLAAVSLHLHVTNDDALQFYKAAGFEVSEWDLPG